MMQYPKHVMDKLSGERVSSLMNQLKDRQAGLLDVVASIILMTQTLIFNFYSYPLDKFLLYTYNTYFVKLLHYYILRTETENTFV